MNLMTANGRTGRCAERIGRCRRALCPQRQRLPASITVGLRASALHEPVRDGDAGRGWAWWNWPRSPADTFVHVDTFPGRAGGPAHRCH